MSAVNLDLFRYDLAHLRSEIGKEDSISRQSSINLDMVGFTYPLQ